MCGPAPAKACVGQHQPRHVWASTSQACVGQHQPRHVWASTSQGSQPRHLCNKRQKNKVLFYVSSVHQWLTISSFISDRVRSTPSPSSVAGACSWCTSLEGQPMVLSSSRMGATCRHVRACAHARVCMCVSTLDRYAKCGATQGWEGWAQGIDVYTGTHIHIPKHSKHKHKMQRRKQPRPPPPPLGIGEPMQETHEATSCGCTEGHGSICACATCGARSRCAAQSRFGVSA